MSAHVIDDRHEVDAAGCWLWTGPMGSDGVYGKWNHTTASRTAFLLWIGPIPAGYEVDHLCRVPLCINPEHLEAVTPAENRRRKYAAVTECLAGHPYDEGNTYIRPTGQRDCRACIRERVRRYRARRSAS